MIFYIDLIFLIAKYMEIEVSAQSNVTDNWHIWHHYQYSTSPSENSLCLDSLLAFTWFMYFGFLNEFRMTSMLFLMQLLIHKGWYNYTFDFSSVYFQKTGNHRFQENITKTFGGKSNRPCKIAYKLLYPGMSYRL